jgi:hypothetical protein
MLGAVQIQNLLYVAVAIIVATVISAFYVLRHRKPKSLEAGIESFSRELKALAPERTRGPGREDRSAPMAVPTDGANGRPGPVGMDHRPGQAVRPRTEMSGAAPGTAASDASRPGPESAATREPKPAQAADDAHERASMEVGDTDDRHSGPPTER